MAAVGLDAFAGLKGHHHTAVALNGPHNLFVDAADGTTGDENSGCALGDSGGFGQQLVRSVRTFVVSAAWHERDMHRKQEK